MKELYARFGAAYYWAECVYRSACLIYVDKAISHLVGITRARVDELFAEANSRTLGQIVVEIAPHLDVKTMQLLDEVVSRRNFLAHHFWFEKIVEMQSVEGVKKLASELWDDQRLFESADNLLLETARGLRVAVGIPDEAVDNMLAELEAGAVPLPAPRSRKLKKQERIVRAWHGGVESELPLVLEADDGVLWQFCDVGLGWCLRDKSQAGWIPHPIITPYLPATIDPRPKGVLPWDYEFNLKGGTLWVKPGPTKSTFNWGLRRHRGERDDSTNVTLTRGSGRSLMSYDFRSGPIPQDELAPLFSNIWNGLIDVVPGEWKAAVLEIQWLNDERGVDRFSHVVTSPEGHQDSVAVPDSLTVSTLALAELFRAYKMRWKTSVFTVHRNTDEEWRCETTFVY